MEKRREEDSFFLFLAESLSFLDGEEQLLFQLLVAFIGRQVQTVKTEETREQGSV